jgi:hypothetical protein
VDHSWLQVATSPSGRVYRCTRCAVDPTEDPDPDAICRSGWLTHNVQQVANAAVAAGLVPVVDDEGGLDLYSPGQAEALGVVGEIAGRVDLYLTELAYDERMDEDLPIEIRGLGRVLAWVAATVPASLTTAP